MNNTNDNHSKTLLIAINCYYDPLGNMLKIFSDDNYDDNYIFINIPERKIELSKLTSSISIDIDILCSLNLKHLDDMSLKNATVILDNIKEYLANYDIIYIATNNISKSLSLFLRLLVSYSHKIGAITVLFVLEPFHFPTNYTKIGISKLKKYTDVTVTISSDCIAKELPKGTCLRDLLCVTKYKFCQCIRKFNELVVDLEQKNVDLYSLRKMMMDKETSWLGGYSSLYINQDNSILSSVAIDIENDIQSDLSRTLEFGSYEYVRISDFKKRKVR